MKKILIVLLIFVGVAYYVLSQYDNVPQTSVNLVCSSDSGQTMDFSQAQSIALGSECIQAGKVLNTGRCNGNGGGLFDIDIQVDKKGCSAVCLVSIDEKSAEIGWRCTGLLL